MKPKLVHKPNNYTYQKLLVNFANGIPLSADQLNFLYRHEKTLSMHGLDPILKYYLKSFYRSAADRSSFLMHRENFDAKSAKELKRRLSLLLKDKKKGERITFTMTAKQFQQLKNATYKSLIFFHGNQMMTGAPFYQGGIPHVVFFQWGNMFGVAKYVVLIEERALRSNIMVYFEEMHERNLKECVEDFRKDMEHELKPDPHHANTHQLDNHEAHKAYNYNSPFAIPKFSLSKGTDHDKDD